MSCILAIILPLQSPVENEDLLCLTEQVWVNYTVVRLEDLVETVMVPLPPSLSMYTIPSITPGTTYTVNVSFVNEVGESMDNPIGQWSHVSHVICHNMSHDASITIN